MVFVFYGLKFMIRLFNSISGELWNFKKSIPLILKENALINPCVFS